MQPVASSRIVSKIKARKNCFINHPFRLLNHVQLHFNKIIDLLNLHCGLFPLILQIPIYLADRQNKQQVTIYQDLTGPVSTWTKFDLG